MISSCTRTGPGPGGPRLHLNACLALTAYNFELNVNAPKSYGAFQCGRQARRVSPKRKLCCGAALFSWLWPICRTPSFPCRINTGRGPFTHARFAVAATESRGSGSAPAGFPLSGFAVYVVPMMSFPDTAQIHSNCSLWPFPSTYVYLSLYMILAHGF
jgi:hypothetical protein